MKNLILIIGMSGSGKTTAAKFFEDKGYDMYINYPLDKFNNDIINNTVMSFNFKNNKRIEKFLENVNRIKKYDINLKLLFLDSSDQVIMSRYEYLRRNHPLNLEKGIFDAIKNERKLMQCLIDSSDISIDTSNLKVKSLYEILENIFIFKKHILFSSFGYKNELPKDSDFIFDARFLENPFYEPELKNLTGNDKAVFDYVMNFDDAREYFEDIKNLIDKNIEIYLKKVKPIVKISVGCTGGKHRSVTLVNALYDYFSEKYKDDIFKFHRELSKDED